MGVADNIQDGMISHQIDLMRYSESVREKVVGHLHELEEELQKQIQKQNLPGAKPQTAFQQQKQKQLLDWSKGVINTAYKKNNQTLKSELLELADVEKDGHVRLLNDALGAKFFRVGMTRHDLQELVSGSMIQGAPAKEWWAKQSADLQGRFAQQIRLGVTQGETNEQLVKRIRGKSTGQKRVLNMGEKGKKVVDVHAGGVMDISKREATTLVRTAVQTVSNNVLVKIYEENGDLLRGVQAIATLDGRTSPVCRARDKKAWAVPADGSPLKAATPDAPPAPAKPAKPQKPAKSAQTPPKPQKSLGAPGKGAAVKAKPSPVLPVPAAPPFEPPFEPKTPPQQILSALMKDKAWAGTNIDKSIKQLPPPTLAELGNSMALMSHHFGGQDLGLTSLSVGKLSNPLHYSQVDEAKTATHLKFGTALQQPVKMNKMLAKEKEKGWFAGNGVGHLFTHELGHVVQRGAPKLVEAATAYVKKHPPSAKELSKYGKTNQKEAFAEALAKVLKTPKEQLNSWESGFLTALNSSLSAAGRPIVEVK